MFIALKTELKYVTQNTLTLLISMIWSILLTRLRMGFSIIFVITLFSININCTDRKRSNSLSHNNYTSNRSSLPLNNNEATKVSYLSKEINLLTKKLEMLNNDYRELSNQKTTLNEEKDRLDQILVNNINQLAEYEHSNLKLEDEKKELVDTINKLKEELSDYRLKLDFYNNAMSSNIKNEDSIAQLNSKLREQSLKEKNINKEVTTLKKEIQDQKALIKKLNDKFSSTKNKNIKLITKNDELKEVNKELNEIAADLFANNNHLNSELSRYKEPIYNMQKIELLPTYLDSSPIKTRSKSILEINDFSNLADEIKETTYENESSSYDSEAEFEEGFESGREEVEAKYEQIFKDHKKNLEDKYAEGLNEGLEVAKQKLLNASTARKTHLKENPTKPEDQSKVSKSNLKSDPQVEHQKTTNSRVIDNSAKTSTKSVDVTVVEPEESTKNNKYEVEILSTIILVYILYVLSSKFINLLKKKKELNVKRKPQTINPKDYITHPPSYTNYDK